MALLRLTEPWSWKRGSGIMLFCRILRERLRPHPETLRYANWAFRGLPEGESSPQPFDWNRHPTASLP
jgi:hypothetical protein